MPRKIENPEDILNITFSNLTVKKYLGRYSKYNIKSKKHYYLCECKCGNKGFEASRYHLQSGMIKSCGCLKTERIRKEKLKHGQHGTRLYYIYRNMLDRCYRVKNEHYKNYGGRGIVVCIEWKNSEDGFIRFREWSIDNGYTDNLTIDRINNNGNYEPDNCRWADRKTQNENKRNVRMFKATNTQGEVFEHFNQTDFAKLHNLDRGRINQCLNNKRKQHKGWTFEYKN